MPTHRKKIRKTAFIVLGAVGLILGGLYTYFRYNFNEEYIHSENKYTHRVAYIDPENSMLAEGFKTCNEYIFDYYNPERATYVNGKNGLRKFILSNYQKKRYSDSGYLNIRFVINCNGEAGRYIVHENDLDLKPKKFDIGLKEQLLNLTIQLKKWNPNRRKARDSEDLVAVDSYMYISYRIENGDITEILP